MSDTTYQSFQEWARHNKVDNIDQFETRLGWEGWTTKKNPFRKQGVQLRINGEEMRPVINVWGVPKSQRAKIILPIAIRDNTRNELERAVPIAMQHNYPDYNSLDAAVTNVVLGVGKLGLFLNADFNTETKPWDIVPCWQVKLNVHEPKGPGTMFIRGLEKIQLTAATGQNKIGDLCNYVAGSTDPTWIVECTTQGPIILDKEKFESVADVFDKLVQTPIYIGKYPSMPEEYLRARMDHLSNSMLDWADQRKELGSFEPIINEIIEEAIMLLMRRQIADEQETISTENIADRRRGV